MTPPPTPAARPAFVDDLPEPAGLLHAVVVASPVAHGCNLRIDVDRRRGSGGCGGACCTAGRHPGREPDRRHHPGRAAAGRRRGSLRRPADGAGGRRDPGQRRAGQRPRCSVRVDELPGVFDPREAARPRSAHRGLTDPRVRRRRRGLGPLRHRRRGPGRLRAARSTSTSRPRRRMALPSRRATGFDCSPPPRRRPPCSGSPPGCSACR